jgi:glycosyltransferase involved in cell wall biosynthesis
MAEEQIVSEVEQDIPKPPRTVIICSRRVITDCSLYLKFLLVGLANESAQVCLVAPPKIDVEPVVPPAFEVLRYPAVELPLMQHYNRGLLLDRMAEFRPELLHCLCESMAQLTRRLSRQLHIPYILNIDSITRPWHPVTISPTRCVAIITPAKSIADHLASAHPKYADRIRQINIGVFPSDTVSSFAHRDRIPGIVIAQPPQAASKQQRGGGLETILRVLHRLAVENQRFMAAVISEGDTCSADSRMSLSGKRTRRVEKRIRSLLRELGLSRAITLIPPLPGYESAIDTADIFVVPRPSSSFNMALLSAMSAGCCVAACKGGVDDLIIDGSTAVVFNQDDQLSIYNALKRLLDAPHFARQIAAQAQEYLRQNYHVSTMVASTLQLYREASEKSKNQKANIKM